MRVYTGVGSRETPDDILRVMQSLAYKLAQQDWTLRSGGAEGADSAFASGAWDARLLGSLAPRPEIYLPWPKFNDIRGTLSKLERPTDEAFSLAKQFHPAWDRLSKGGKMLHARNVHQVLGPDVTNPVPSRFLICWTPDAEGGGGTGQAIRIAQHYEIPVFDLADNDAQLRVRHFVFGT